MSTRRKLLIGIFLAVGILLVALAFAVYLLIPVVGGASSKDPARLKADLSPGAQKLLKRAREGIDPARLTDYHTHIVATGRQVKGAFFNPHMESLTNPVGYLKFQIYKSALGVSDMDTADTDAELRLRNLIRHIPGHGVHYLVAFDKHYDSKARLNLEKTEFHVPNEYVMELARKYPEYYRPMVSIHPYRPDALQELEKWAKQGARFVKWLPNAMGMDPADVRCEAFYRIMKKYDMTLLTHAGTEKAVEAEDDQKMGNPLRLRKPLTMGVRVMVAHLASLGQGEDLDSMTGGRLDNFKLFTRLMDDPRYKNLLYAEISALTQANRLGEPLLTVLSRPDWWPRLRNGSDYPLPAINILFRLSDFVDQGYIDGDEKKYLAEIYDFNPLLFDFVLKRTVKKPGTDIRLPPSVFMRDPKSGL